MQAARQKRLRTSHFAQPTSFVGPAPLTRTTTKPKDGLTTDERVRSVGTPGPTVQLRGGGGKTRCLAIASFVSQCVPWISVAVPCINDKCITKRSVASQGAHAVTAMKNVVLVYDEIFGSVALRQWCAHGPQNSAAMSMCVWSCQVSSNRGEIGETARDSITTTGSQTLLSFRQTRFQVEPL